MFSPSADLRTPHRGCAGTCAMAVLVLLVSLVGKSAWLTCVTFVSSSCALIGIERLPICECRHYCDSFVRCRVIRRRCGRARVSKDVSKAPKIHRNIWSDPGRQSTPLFRKARNRMGTTGACLANLLVHPTILYPQICTSGCGVETVRI